MKSAGVFAVMAAAMAAGYLVSASLSDGDGGRAELLTQSANAAIAETPAEPAAGLGQALPSLSGETRALADWNGSVRIVNFWATWCAPCRREIPLLKDIQHEHGAAGLQVVGVAMDTLDAVTEFSTDEPFNYPVLLAEEEAYGLAQSFGVDVMALPLTLFLAPDGTLVNAHIGEFHASEAEDVVPVLLKLAAGGLDPDTARRTLAEL
ncbi:MAG: TlpA disulfide reductase family protein [Pseudomonadota bacterium]